MIVTFEDYTPIPRYDGNHWTHITIEEGASAAGPWTLIDTLSILPVDTDPRQPAARSFSTENATLQHGWYRISFTDAFGNTLPTDPRQNIDPDEAPFLPTVRDVALKILSRTRDAFGNLQGTFTSDTTPSEADVLRIIRQVSTEVADEIGDDVPPELYDDAANIIALKAAMQIEMSYFADQVNTGRSIYPQLEKLYETEIPRLMRAIVLVKEGDAGIETSQPTNKAQWSFPDAVTGWGTRW